MQQAIPKKPAKPLAWTSLSSFEATSTLHVARSPYENSIQGRIS